MPRYQLNGQLGRRAEGRFKTICADAGFTCNESIEDDHGWDFLVEYIPKGDARLPADKRPGPRQVLVQVKSTQSRTPRTRLKVSNALKLTNSELPCFLVLFHWPRSGVDKRIYAKHIWAEAMSQSLRRGRELTKTKSLINKARLTMNFDDEDDHTLDLADWKKATVEELGSDYGERKRRLRETLGYEGGLYRAEVMVGPLRGIEDIVDHQLRIKERLPVTRFKLVDPRFGIDMPVPDGEGGPGHVVFELNNERPLKVVMRTSGEEAIVLPAKARYPILPGLPPDKFKIVVETWIFRLIISGESADLVEVRDLLSETLELEQVVVLSKFFSWVGRPIAVSIFGEGLPNSLITGQLSVNGGNRELFRDLSGMAVTLRKIEHEAGESDVRMSLEDMYESRVHLSFFHQVLAGKNMHLTADVDPDWKHLVGQTRLMSYVDCVVGKCSFFVVFDMAVNDRSPETDRVDFDCGNRELVDCFVGSDVSSVRTAGLASFNNHKAKNAPEHILVEDFRSFAAS